MLKKIRLVLRLLNTSFQVLLDEIQERIIRNDREKDEDNNNGNFFDS